MNRTLSVRNITMIAVMGALGAVLMLYDFPIAIAPSFYKLDLGDLPCLIGAFAMGPLPAVFIQLVKILIKLLLKPTSSAFVGEIAAFVCSTSFCVSASLIYEHHKTRQGALWAMAFATLIMAFTAAFANYIFIIPAYVELYHMPLEAIIGLGSEIFPAVHDKFTFVLYCVFPFNLIKGALVSALTFLLYKRISFLIKGRQA